MLNFTTPLTMNDLGNLKAEALLKEIDAFCMTGKAMHPQALQAVVFKLTYYTRDLSLKQDERDASASLATNFANAAIKAYGAQSEYGRGLVNGVKSILSSPAAA